MKLYLKLLITGEIKMSEAKKKLFIMVTNGPENPELATIPFVMATSAQASDVEVVMGFQGNGSMLMIKGIAEHVAAKGFPTLVDMIGLYAEAGGKMYVCGPCVGARQVKDGELVDGAVIVGGATFVSECLDSTQSLIY
ncbi:sulfur reduction protein DsrE [Thiothrix subterranea]|uniref:DsrE family protein n=1 Tax=Thiothrix subterranea TaxID=2735563 RepID=UPI00192A7D14|nr:DsrE family protein [Thiothrix subterranea]QQZ28616.1 sulfur reduction protein DsrE [Thiothrix subterranea]